MRILDREWCRSQSRDACAATGFAHLRSRLAAIDALPCDRLPRAAGERNRRRDGAGDVLENGSMSATPRLATTAPPRAFLGRVRSRLSLILVLAAAGLVQTGCSSPCTSCGSGSGLLSRVRERVFTRRVFRPVPAAGCCGDSVGAVPVETAPTVVTPGTTVVPPADANPDLEAIPRVKSVPPDGAKSSSSANKPTSYEASRPARDLSAREVVPGPSNNYARILIPNNSAAQTPAGGGAVVSERPRQPAAARASRRDRQAGAHPRRRRLAARPRRLRDPRAARRAAGQLRRASSRDRQTGP